jgi:dienelactone hydrolase
MPATADHFVSNSKSIAIDMFMPTSPGRRPATLVLHGTFGLEPEFRADLISFGEALAASGVVAAIPHYFERTGTRPGIEATLASDADLAQWTAACGDALAFLRDHPAVDGGRLAVLGFSLGGHLALTLGMAPPRGTSLKAVVDFFGPTSRLRLTGNRAALPPLLIHHGTADAIVPIQDSLTLESELKAVGKIAGVGYQLISYPGQGHAFTAPAVAASRQATVDFLGAII